MQLPATSHSAVSPPHSRSSSPPSRPRVPEEEDCAERPGSAPEPGGDHVQPARVPGDSQVGTHAAPSLCGARAPAWARAAGAESTARGACSLAWRRLPLETWIPSRQAGALLAGWAAGASTRLRPWPPSSTPSWVSTSPLSQGLAHCLPLPALKLPRAPPDTQQLCCPLSQQGAQPLCRADTLLLPLASPCSSRCAGAHPSGCASLCPGVLAAGST